MTFGEYQNAASKTAIYPKMKWEQKDIDVSYLYPVLGLVGETGEFAEKIKKIIRNNEGLITQEKKEDLKKELGDCLWYLATICSELNIYMHEVAEMNIQKLKDRSDRGVIKSQGDNR